MKSIDKVFQILGGGILIANSLFAIYTAGFGLLSAIEQRGIHLLLLSLGLFLMYKPKDGSSLRSKVISRCINFLFLGSCLVSGVYLLTVWEDKVFRIGGSTTLDTIMAVLMIVVIIEATRRTTGKALTIIVVMFLAYAVWGNYIPGILSHSGMSVERLSNFLYFTTEGIFGIPLGISATFIIVFVLFGAFLEQFGSGKWFIDVSYALTGKYRGGPAKTAVVSSGLMGMLSGSPVANVATTGTFTIPLMKKVGFSPKHAGAVEAVASTGGMITPPIMGAAAFIMAEYLNIPYKSVIIAAIVPAFLFYLALLLSVDSLSVKNKLVGLDKSELPKLGSVMKERGYLSIPLLFLIVMISSGWSPMKAAFWAIIITCLIGYISPSNRPNIKSLGTALLNGSKSVISVALACASAGIIVGIISITGLGAKLSFALIDLSQGSILLALFLSMIIIIILGFGMPPTAVYIILVAILIPPLVDLGVSPLSAHMFLFFFSTLAALTPPVAITAFAAAAIAKAQPNETGFASFRLGILAYLIPFIFVFSPELLLQGTPTKIILAIISAIIGVCCLVASIEGYFLMNWNYILRIPLFLAAILLLYSGWITDISALFIIIISFYSQRYILKKNTGRLKNKENYV